MTFRHPLMKLLRLLCCLFLAGCGRCYFTEEVTPAMLVGTWKTDMNEAFNAVETGRSRKANLVLLPTGKFTATAFPLVNPHGALEFVNDHGTWILQKNLKKGGDGEGPRWRVALIMDDHRVRADWDLFESNDSTPALGILYGLDGDEEDSGSREIMLTRVSPGSGATTAPEGDPLLQYQVVKGGNKGAGGG